MPDDGLEQPSGVSRYPMLAVKSFPLWSSRLLLMAGRSGWTAWGQLYVLAWGIMAILVLTASLGTYVFHSRSSFVKAATAFVPIPYGFVGIHPLWLDSYNDDVSALTRFYGQKNLTDQSAPSPSVISQLAKSHTARRSMLNELAGQYGVWVTKKEIDAEFTKLSVQAQSEKQVAATIRSFWGWSVGDFRRQMLRPLLLADRVGDKLKSDPVIGRELSGAADPRALDVYIDKLAPTRIVYWFDPVGE